MYGTNPVRHRESLIDGVGYRVQEIFYTLQGEGPFANYPAVFVRLAGCNLRCHFCDTDFESNYNNVLTAPQIAEKACTLIGEGQSLNPRVRREPTALLVVTGGEPFLQPLVPLLTEFLVHCKPAWHVQIETAGTLWDEELDLLGDRQCFSLGPVAGLYSIVVSPKTAKIHPEIEHRAFAYKYIVSALDNAPDGLPSQSTQRTGYETLARPHGSLARDRIFVQPMDVGGPLANQMNLQHAAKVAMQHGYRLSVQTHKLAKLP